MVFLGLTWLIDDRRRVAALNPEPDFDLADGDEIIVLVRGSENVSYEEVEPKNVHIGEPQPLIVATYKRFLLSAGISTSLIQSRSYRRIACKDCSITVASTVDSETVLEIHERTEWVRSGHKYRPISESDTQVVKSVPHQYDVIIQMGIKQT